MPRTPEQNKNIKDKRRAKLLTFALKAFAVNGYDHTAIDDITKAAKCSHGLFYHYFSSKEAVFAALIEETLVGEIVDSIPKAKELRGTAGLRLWAKIGELIANGTAKDCAVAKIILECPKAINLDPVGRRFANDHDLYAVLVELVHQGQEEGKVIAGDPRQVAQALFDLSVSIVNRHFNKEGVAVSADVLYALTLKTPLVD